MARMFMLRKTTAVSIFVSTMVFGVCVDGVAQSRDDSLATVTPPGFGEIRPGVVETKPLADSPFSLSEREFILLEKKQQRENGWTAAREGQVSEFDMYFDTESAFYLRGKRNLNESLNYLQFVPASFDGTLFERARLHTVMHAGGYVNGAWTGVIRTMTIPKLGRVVLEEYDYVAAGSHIQIAEEVADSEINGKPSIFTVWKEPGGRMVTEFEWFTDNKHFRLLLDGAVVQSSIRYQELVELATALR